MYICGYGYALVRRLLMQLYECLDSNKMLEKLSKIFSYINIAENKNYMIFLIDFFPPDYKKAYSSEILF
jgi:hypothetical protein